MKSLIKNITLLLLVAVFSNTLFAQDDCLVTLKKVQKDYEEGIIEKIPETLSECLKGGLKGEDKITAYKLLINVYLFDDKVDKAEEAMEKLLVFEPEMKPNEAIDSKEFITLFESYRTTPLYSIGFTGGVNYSIITINKEFGTYNTDTYEGEYTAPDFGFQVGLNANYLIYKNVYLKHHTLSKGFNYHNTRIFSYSSMRVHIISPGPSSIHVITHTKIYINNIATYSFAQNFISTIKLRSINLSH